MNKHDILAFLRVSYNKAELEGKSEKEKAYAVIEDFTEALGWKITSSKEGMFKSSTISIITDLGMRVITHKDGSTSSQSKSFDSFTNKAYSALFIKYNGVGQARLRANYNSDSTNEIYIKDMANLLLAIGYGIKDLTTDKKRHKIYLTDVAMAHGLANDDLDTSFTATDAFDWIEKYGKVTFWLIVLVVIIVLSNM
jgi:hypothetical protein